MENNYTEIGQDNVTQRMLDDCVERGAIADLSHLRTSKHATPRVILKWVRRTPTSLGSVTVYTKAEIHIELAKPEWDLGVSSGPIHNSSFS